MHKWKVWPDRFQDVGKLPQLVMLLALVARHEPWESSRKVEPISNPENILKEKKEKVFVKQAYTSVKAGNA